MKLSEIDKSERPVKVVSKVTGEIFKVTCMDDKYALVYDDKSEPHIYRSDADLWSPYQEQKPKRALYAYKTKRGDEWAVSSFFYKSDKEFIDYMSDVEEFECQRLLWSEVEV